MIYIENLIEPCSLSTFVWLHDHNMFLVFL